jgi:hypothetical protein
MSIQKSESAQIMSSNERQCHRIRCRYSPAHGKSAAKQLLIYEDIESRTNTK